MAVKLISVKCPVCGAALDIEEDRDQAFCAYCGTKVLLHNENEYIYRHVDEAEIKQAETDRMVRMKQLEYEERERIDSKKSKEQRNKVLLILFSISMLLMLIGTVASIVSDDGNLGFQLCLLGCLPLFGIACIWGISYINEDDKDINHRAKQPSFDPYYESISYDTLESVCVNAGFTNVKCVPLNDLTKENMMISGMVESVTINGWNVTSIDENNPKDADIVIYYHSIYRYPQ